MIVVSALFVILFSAGPAAAHGELDRSEPPNGGSVAVGRTSITLWYSEGISAPASSFELITVDGIRAGINTTVSDIEGGSFVEIETTPLLKTTYLLNWSVLSLEDGHRAGGSVLFGVGGRPDIVATSGLGLPGRWDLLVRWLDLTFLTLAVGALAVSARVFRSGLDGAERHRLRLWYVTVLATLAALVTGFVTPFLRMPRGGASFRGWVYATSAMITGTPWGRLWTGRLVATGILATVLLLHVIRTKKARWPIRLAWVALASVVLLESFAGHASGLPRDSTVAALVSASHLAAAGVWAGGLAAMGLLLGNRRRARHPLGAPRLQGWQAFSPMAAIATVVLIASGIYESGRHIPDFGDVTETVYGGAVAAKLVLAALALLFAGLNTVIVNRRLRLAAGALFEKPSGWLPISPRRFRTVVAAELMLLCLATVAAALVTSVPTAKEIESAAAETAPHHVTEDGLFITLEEVPAGSSQNRFIVRTRAVDRPAPGQVSGIDIGLTGPDGQTRTLVLELIEEGRHEVETERTGPGQWQAEVIVHRDGASDVVTVVDWFVAERRPEQARTLEVISTLLATLIVIGLAFAIRYARRLRPLAVSTPAGENRIRPLNEPSAEAETPSRVREPSQL